MSKFNHGLQPNYVSIHADIYNDAVSQLLDCQKKIAKLQKEICCIDEFQKRRDRILRKRCEVSEKLIERISGMCGTPDAVKGCRNILQEIKNHGCNNTIRNEKE